MAKTTPQAGNDWPTQPYNKLIDEDSQIVRVPLANVDWGSRPSVMKKIENRNGMDIKHIPSGGGKGSK